MNPEFSNFYVITKQYSDLSMQLKIFKKEYRVNVTAGNYIPIYIDLPPGEVMAKIPVVSYCSDKPDVYSPLLHTEKRILVMSPTSQEVGVIVYILYASEN